MDAKNEIIPRPLEKNKHVRPERIPDPRMWATEEEARAALSQSDSTEMPVVPEDFTCDLPAVREIRERKWKLEEMDKMTDAERAKVWQDIAKEALKVMADSA